MIRPSMIMVLLLFPLSLGCSEEGSSSGESEGGDALEAPDSTDATDGDADVPGVDAEDPEGGGDDIAQDATQQEEDDIAQEDPFASSGCGKDSAGLATDLLVDDKERTFVLSLPNDYDIAHPHPLVFAWHGLGGSGPLAKTYFGLQFVAGNEAIIVYPSALPQANFGGQPGWDLFPTGYDFAFFDAMLAHLLDGLCVDTSRVFATGHSFGGYMSNALGCHRASVLSAIAPVAGGPPSFGTCKGPVAAWLTHGSADDVVPLSEGTGARDTWLNMNGCSETAAATEPSPCVAYEGCERDVHWCEHTGGHEWPSFAPGAIWSFFASQ